MPRDTRPHRDSQTLAPRSPPYAHPHPAHPHHHAHPYDLERSLPPPPRYRAPPPPPPPFRSLVPERAPAHPRSLAAPLPPARPPAFALAPPIDLDSDVDLDSDDMSRRGSSSSKARAPASLGLEDELSFGSDEDTLDTVGEIPMPLSMSAAKAAAPPVAAAADPRRSSTLSKSSKSSKGSALETIREKRRLRKETNASLASSTIVQTPSPPPVHVLELPDAWEKNKRSSFVGAFRGLRKKSDGSQSGSTYGSSVNLSKITTNSSYSQTIPISPQSSRAPSSPALPTLAPIRMSPFEPSPRLAHRPSMASVSSAGTDVVDLSFFPTPHNAVPTPSLSTMSKVPSSTYLDRSPSISSSAVTRPSTGTSRTSGSGSGKRRHLNLALASVILPAYPAGLSSLESIQVLVASVEKRMESRVAAGGMSGSNSSRSIFRAAPKWTPTTLVFTRFKLSLDDFGDDNPLEDGERTVAHLHVFALAPSSPTPKKKTLLPTYEDRVEVERRAVGRHTTAGVWNEAHVNEKGSVLRVGFGEDTPIGGSTDWLFQMRDGSQLHEWIRQIKKTSTMIKAEDMGLGHAIRAAYESASVGADDLALKLAMHNTPQPDLTPRPIQTEALSPLDPTFDRLTISGGKRLDVERADVRASHPFEYDLPASVETAAPSAPDERLDTLAILSGAALGRSRSFDEQASMHSLSGRPRASHRKSLSDSIPSIPSLTSDTSNSGSLLEYYYRSRGAAPSVRSHSSLSRGIDPHAVGAAHSVNKRASWTSYSSRHGAAALPPAPPPPTAPLPPNPLEVTVDGSPARAAVSPTFLSTPKARPARLPAVSVAADLEDTPTLGSAASVASTPGLTPDDQRALGAQVFMRGYADSEAGSIAPSESSSTRRLRRLRGKPKAIDIMAEFSAQEAEMYAGDDEEEPIREDRARRIRFAED